MDKFEINVQQVCQRLGMNYQKHGSNTYLLANQFGRFVIWEAEGQPWWCPLKDFQQPIRRERSVKASVVA